MRRLIRVVVIVWTVLLIAGLILSGAQHEPTPVPAQAHKEQAQREEVRQQNEREAQFQRELREAK